MTPAELLCLGVATSPTGESRLGSRDPAHDWGKRALADEARHRPTVWTDSPVRSRLGVEEAEDEEPRPAGQEAI